MDIKDKGLGLFECVLRYFVKEMFLGLEVKLEGDYIIKRSSGGWWRRYNWIYCLGFHNILTCVQCFLVHISKYHVL